MLLYGFLSYIFWKTSYKQRAFYLQKKKKKSYFEKPTVWLRRKEYEEGIDIAQVAKL